MVVAVRSTRAVSDKRAAILAAALELFNERSFNGTPIPLVAERAGVGAGTIYRYFDSKEALGNAVFRACKTALQRHLLERIRGGLSPREDFRAMWRGLWEFFRDHPAAFQFLETHNHDSYLDAESVATSEAMFVSICDFVRSGQSTGVLRQGAPAVLIAMAFGAFIGLVKESAAGRFDLTESVVDAGEEIVWKMLRA
jgi:AcrR family transcriptional regulator